MKMTYTGSSAFTYKEFYSIINEKIKQENLPQNPKDLYVPIKYAMFTGGKRIRAVLTLMAYNCYKQDISPVLYSALGIEVFHNFTLLHDDMMDNSPMRRNQPTVHKKWNTNTAILSGDAMQILAYKYIAQCSSEKLPQVLDVFTKASLEVCEGQMLDMEFEQKTNVTIDEYLQMIRLKTAALIACSLKIGGILGEADSMDIEKLYQLGIHLGIAFQIQDDYLDAFGNMNRTGKRVGGDIVAQKKTYLLIKALEYAKGTKLYDGLIFLLKNKVDNQEKIQQVIDIFTELGIKKTTENLIEKYFNTALSLLNQLQVKTEKKEELQKFIEEVRRRKE